MSSSETIEQLQAEADYCHGRVALLRAKLYRWGLGSNERLQSPERELERGRRRRREARLRTKP